MLDIQRDVREAADAPIPIEERCEVIQGLLDIVYPDHKSPQDTSSDYLIDLAVAADKYDMPGVTRCVKTLATGSEFPPLELYRLATKLGWDTEANLAAKRTLAFDLDCPAHRHALSRIDSEKVLDLHGLHRRRKAALLDGLHLYAIYIPDFLCDKTSNVMTLWNAIRIDHGQCEWEVKSPYASEPSLPTQEFRMAWIVFLYYVLRGMDSDSSGDKFKGDAFWNSPLMGYLWATTCPDCGELLSNSFKMQLKSALLRDVERLPETIGLQLEATSIFG